MRYVLVTVGLLFYTGVIFDVAPFQVLVTWAVMVVLAALGFFGARRGNRHRALQRQIFLNDSLIGYMEKVDDDRKRQAGN